MAYEKIIYEVDGDGVCRITLNDPQRMNPLGWPLLAELDNALKEAERDGNVRVIIIKGAGRCFSAGYDLGSGEGLTGPRGRKEYGRSIWNSRAHVQGHIEYWFNIWNLWKPVIAQVHGYCLAGASELAAICDLMVVSDDLRYGYPPTRWMASGDTIAIYSWHAGLKIAKEMSFGRILSGEECLRYGFANYCFSKDKLEEETSKIAKRIAGMHPELLSLSKRVVSRTFDAMGFRLSLEYGGEFDSLSHFGQGYGYREAVEKYGLADGLKKLNEPWGGI
ncbi:MAG: enoyl-CoA hydratase/isomerase family protein [Chloroflexi bacterium]|nr:enoyl-CoA hydratase/isomerase family protein [Chloroflexota bacterium]